MSLAKVLAGTLATVVTSLEMTARPALQDPGASGLRLARLHDPDPDTYRALFRTVGQRWLWFSRLATDDATLAAIIHHDAVEIYAVLDQAGEDVGMLELDFRAEATCELAFFGLVPGLTGQGHGRWLMHAALTLAWRPGVARVWLHSCTLDHPAALPFYLANGFTAYARAVETFRDPRLTGLLPRDCASQVPLLD